MNKILWIDIMKGLGMLAVVIGHIYVGEISRNIFIFHMPLFFFVSGYLFKPTFEYKNYFFKKVVHLLIPYFSFLIPLYITFTDFPSLDIKEILRYFSRPIIGGVMLNGYFGVFWFVTCLFLTQQIMNYLINKLNSKKLLLLILVILIVSYSNKYMFPQVWLPWNLNVVFHSIPIFYVGYIYKKRNFNINKIFLVLLGFLVILFSFAFPENVYDMKFAEYGIPIITFISSLILILIIKLISIELSNYKLSNYIFSEIGKASMVIMYLHMPIYILTKSYFSKNLTICFLTAIILTYIIHLVLSKFKFGKAFFLGSYMHFKEVWKPLMKFAKQVKAKSV